MSKRPVLLLGGRSAIGLAIARRFAADGQAVQLAARQHETLEPERSDISLRYDVPVTLHELDISDGASASRFFDKLPEAPGIVICAVGLLGDQDEVESDCDKARLIVETNFTGPTVFLEEASRRLSALDGNTAIVGISSVAGDRGRAKNYWYGASKAGFTTALSGLRQKYSRSRLHILTVKPGFVATPMTAAMKTPPLLEHFLI